MSRTRSTGPALPSFAKVAVYGSLSTPSSSDEVMMDNVIWAGLTTIASVLFPVARLGDLQTQFLERWANWVPRARDLPSPRSHTTRIIITNRSSRDLEGAEIQKEIQKRWPECLARFGCWSPRTMR